MSVQDPSTIPLKHVNVAANADGDNEIVAAVAGKQIAVIAYHLQVVTTAGVWKFQDTAGTPNVFGEFDGALRDQFKYAGSLEAPAFVTAAGNGLEINNGAGVDVRGWLTYAEID